jgi:hypothetical protein
MTLDLPGMCVDVAFLGLWFALWRQVRGLRDDLYEGRSKGRKKKEER